jgi:6-phosphogluconolactonase
MRRVTLAVSFLLLFMAAHTTIAAQNAAAANGISAVGAVFVMTNDVTQNEIISFSRAADGTLQQTRKYATGGRGSGGVIDPLESQGSLTLSQDRAFLFAVNAGSGEISVLRVLGAQLALVDTEPSGGSEPNAVAQYGNLVYVLNVGGGSNVVGFRLDSTGHLRQISNATRFLSTNNSEGASLAFSPDGQFLLVSERATNQIDAFRVRPDGTLSSRIDNSDLAPGAFALTFARNGTLLVSETGPVGGNNASTISSYAVGVDGSLSPITTALPTLGIANCWNAVTPDGRFVYVSNAGSSTLSAFTIGLHGTLAAVGATVVAANPAGSANLDIAITPDGQFLYSLNSGSGDIGIYAIQQDGSLRGVGIVSGLAPAAGFNGIAAF